MSKLDFNNTELAFKDKSDKELKKAYWLFRLVAPFNNNVLASMAASTANILLSYNLPIIRMPMKILFKHFCGGGTIEECRGTISALANSGIKTTLDYCIEALEKESDLDESCNEIIRNVEEAKNDERIPFCVFKVTSVARSALLEKMSARQPLSELESQEYARAERRVDTICETAFKSNVQMLIDAEESWFQNAIDDLASKMMRLYNKQKAVVFNTFQMYRKDRMGFLSKSYEQAITEGYYLGIKLVRGAYIERERDRAAKMRYPSPIHETKDDTDNAYNLALQFCIENIDRISVYAGTHNQASIQILVDLLEKNNIPRDATNIYTSQLYGMGDNITFILAREGYNVTKFVPYGKLESALPYLIRRARENSAVRGHVGRELSLLTLEMDRRRTVS